MTDIILEFVRAIVLFGIVFYLWRAARGKSGITGRGWNYITCGFSLLLLGSVSDITDNFEALNRFVIIGDTPTQAFLEKFVGFLCGFLVLAYGLIKWIPSVTHMSAEIQQRKVAEKYLLDTQLDLKKALCAAEEYNELQRQFVSMASHEFRTPLTIIDNSSQRLLRQAGNGKQTTQSVSRRAEKIRSAVRRMTLLMESTLSAARMDEGKITITIEPCDIARIVREVCERHQEIAERHLITIDDSGLPNSIMADCSAVEQVLENLLSNAVKYAPDAPDIRVRAATDGDHVVISVSDDGCGIDADELAKIGERFFRARTSTGIAGTGIGLNLATTLIRYHDGKLDVASETGRGSTFTVRLPIAGPASMEQAA